MSVLFIVKGPDKQPYELVPYVVDFRKYMATGEVISSIAARVYVAGEDPELVYEPTLLYSVAYLGTRAQIRVQGGTDGVIYRGRIRVQTVVGNRYEAEVEYNVIEVK